MERFFKVASFSVFLLVCNFGNSAFGQQVGDIYARFYFILNSHNYDYNKTSIKIEIDGIEKVNKLVPPSQYEYNIKLSSRPKSFKVSVSNVKNSTCTNKTLVFNGTYGSGTCNEPTWSVEQRCAMQMFDAVLWTLPQPITTTPSLVSGGTIACPDDIVITTGSHYLNNSKYLEVYEPGDDEWHKIPTEFIIPTTTPPEFKYKLKSGDIFYRANRRVYNAPYYFRIYSPKTACDTNPFSSLHPDSDYNEGPPSGFSISYPPPQISNSNISVTNPSCTGYPDAKIDIKSLVGGATGYGFTISRYTKEGEGGCPVGDTTITLINGETRDVCLSTEVYNFSRSKLVSKWQNDGIVIMDTITVLDKSGSSRKLPITAGIWELQIEGLGTDAKCPAVYNVEVTDPQKVEVFIDSKSTTTICPNTLTGEIHLSGKGGTGAYQFKFSDDADLSDDAWGTKDSLVSQPKGTYLVQVKDGNNCVSTSKSYTIGTYTAPTVSVTVTSIYGGTGRHVSCHDRADGSISIEGSGTSTLQYYVDGSPISGTTKSGLTPGSHTVTVEDINTCKDSTSVTINNVPAFTAARSGKTDATCYGASDGSITLNLANYVGTVSYTLDGSSRARDSGTDTEPLFKVAAGSHTFDTIKYTLTAPSYGTKECQATLSNLTDIPISQPAQLSFTRTNYTSPTCIGGSDGSIEIAGHGGSGNYEYTIDGETKTGATVTFTNKSAGSYILSIRDSNSTIICQIDTVVALPARTDFLNATTSATLPDCHGTATGSITVTGVDGDPPYTFAIDLGSGLTFTEPKASHTFTNLAGNATYDVYIRDQHCEKKVSVAMGDPEPVTATWEVNDVKCFGGSDGAVLLTPSGGTGTYTFAWTNEAGDTVSTEEDPNSLIAGVYDVAIKDSHNCTVVYPGITVNEPTEFVVDTVITKEETCTGRSDGSADIRVSGGTSPYYYSIDNSAFVTSSLRTGLLNGAHTYTVNDDNGCSHSGTFDIDLVVVDVDLISSQDLLCHEDSTGYIELSAFGGVSAYTYSIDSGSNFQSSNIFSDLPAGEYFLLAKDNRECLSTVDTLVLTEPDLLQGSLNIIQEEACDQSDGLAELAVTGGTGLYAINWYDKNLQAANPNGLSQGRYTIEVTDEHNCFWADTFDITNTPAPTLSYAIEDSSWCGKPLGKATVSATGGFSPYQYLWNDELAQQTATATSLKENIYEVLVTDSRNCQSTIAVEMVDGEPLHLVSKTITPSGCAIAEGTISVTIGGGVSPYQYAWPDSVTTASGPYADQLFAGVYPVQVSDSVGCTLDLLLEVSNTDSPVIDTVITTPSYCGLATGSLYAEASEGTGALQYRWLATGWEYVGAAADSIPEGSYLLEVADSKGCRTYRNVSISDDLSVEPTLSLVGYDSSACEKPVGRIAVAMTGGDTPYTYQWDDPALQTTAEIEGLYASVYNVVATDAKGCVKTLQQRIVDKADLGLSYLGKTRSRCDSPTGTATVQASLGTGSYLYHWDDSLNQQTATASNLAPGHYTVYATDGHGCATDTFSIQIVYEENPIVKLAALEPVTCYGVADGFAEVSITGGKTPYSILWNDPAAQTTARAENLGKGEYAVEVIDDNGCLAGYNVEIQEPDSLYIFQINIQQPICHKVCDGALLAEATGGNYPYTYQLSDGSTGPAIEEICPGLYALHIEDRKGCAVDTTFEMMSVPRIDLGLSEHVEICGGGTYIVDAGEWQSYEWSSETGVISTERKASLTKVGNYFLHVETFKGCDVYDTLYLEVRNDLMEADYLTDSEILAGDTVELIDISWPVPDRIEWIYPDSVILVEESDDRIVLVFPDSGSYEIAIDAYSGECHDYWSNTIVVLSPQNDDEAPSGGRLGYREDLIKSFTIYPNPNSGAFTARVELTQESAIQMELFEVQYGKTVKIHKAEGSDNYEVSFREELTNGMYYLKLEATGERKVIKFLVVK